MGRLETFAGKVKDGLHQADFQTRRDIIRALVKRVEVDEQQLRIVFRVCPMSFPPSSEDAPYNLPPGLVSAQAITEVAGKRKHGKTTKGNPYLRALLAEIVWAISHTKNYL